MPTLSYRFCWKLFVLGVTWSLCQGPAMDAAHAQSARQMTADDVERWMAELSNWGRWGKEDQLGAINLITPRKRKLAVGLVKDGISVSLARNTETAAAPDNPSPFGHKMLATGSDLVSQWSMDNFSVSYHGYAHTHMDSLCHIFDNCDLEELAKVAAELGRWEFLITAAPIPVTGGTGSPLNPIATF